MIVDETSRSFICIDHYPLSRYSISLWYGLCGRYIYNILSSSIILMTARHRQAVMAKPLIITVGIGLVMMMTLASVVSMASAQPSGTIASIQNGDSLHG
jgi:hypothetical protein